MEPRKSKSFTLLEIVIALVLIAIIILIFFIALVTSCSNLRRVVELRTVTLILQEQISKTRELKYSDIQSLGGSFSSSYMVSLNNATGTITKSPYNGHADIIKITFGLDWTTFEGKQAHKTVVALMTRRGINKK